MKKNLTLHIHIQQDLVESFEKMIKEKQRKPGTYINQLLRENLSEEGYL